MKKLWFASAAIVALSGSMFADTVSGVSPSAFGFGGATPTWINKATNPGGGIPFWNDASDDTGLGPGQSASHMMNIGYVLTGTGGMTGMPSVIGSDTVTTEDVGTGGADPSAFSFVRNATAYNISLIFADSALDTGNSWLTGGGAAVGSVFGYYVGNTWTPLYTVGQTTSRTGTQTFNPAPAGSSYGFYETVCYTVTAGVCTDYATYTTGNGTIGPDQGGAGWNHFALFQLASGAYVLGFTGQNGIFGEDLGDFQDTVVEISLVAAPEPGTIGIIGLGLAALGFLGRRRFAKK